MSKFIYEYDVTTINLDNTKINFLWTDEECTSFTINLNDTQNSELKKSKFVAFSLDN